MTEDQSKKVRTYFHSVSGLQQLFDKPAGKRIGPVGMTAVEVVDRSMVLQLAEELENVERDFPGLLPSFKKEQFSYPGGSDYRVEPIRIYLAKAIARLRVEVDIIETTPITQTREFSFVKDASLRNILERDYGEIQRAYVSKCWKSVIILSGAAIEAMLLQHLLKDAARAVAAKNAPSQPDLTKWDLAHLIDVSLELGAVTEGVQTLSHSVRQYRNLIHPGNEIRNKLTFDTEEARIAIEVLHIVCRDLSG